MMRTTKISYQDDYSHYLTERKGLMTSDRSKRSGRVSRNGMDQMLSSEGIVSPA